MRGTTDNTAELQREDGEVSVDILHMSIRVGKLVRQPQHHAYWYGVDSTRRYCLLRQCYLGLLIVEDFQVFCQAGGAATARLGQLGSSISSPRDPVRSVTVQSQKNLDLWDSTRMTRQAADKTRNRNTKLMSTDAYFAVLLHSMTGSKTAQHLA